MYIDEGIPMSKVLEELQAPSRSMAYRWVQSHMKKQPLALNLSMKEIKDLKDIKPSEGFKTSAEELRHLRLLKILPSLVSELKKKGRIT